MYLINRTKTYRENAKEKPRAEKSEVDLSSTFLEFLFTKSHIHQLYELTSFNAY